MNIAMDKIDPCTHHDAELDTASRPLTTLKKGTHARIVQVYELTEFGQNNLSVSQRLKELGFLPGTVIRVLGFGFGFLNNAPIAIGINGTKFALRPAEAKKILVVPIALN